MINLAIFASGSGTNAEALVKYFRNHPVIRVVLIISNNPGAGVLERAKNLHVGHSVITADVLAGPGITEILSTYAVNFILLAGFLKKIPAHLLASFPDRIINIHPALLPKFGGKGMYGRRVHEAVLAAGEKQSGITIHLVNEAYDKGDILFQKTLDIRPSDNPGSLAERIHFLEHEFYPKVVEKYVQDFT